MRKYLTTILLVLTLPIGEVHTFWAKDDTIQNWIWKWEMPMLVHWNLKFAEQQINIIIYFVAWLLWQPNRINKTTIWAFFWLAIFDTLMYFYNYKTGGFGKIYFWFVGFWLVAYYWQLIKKRLFG